jgi:hypothetical protein
MRIKKYLIAPAGRIAAILSLKVRRSINQRLSSYQL